MNRGIDLASGELIGIINGDDWYNYEALEIIINNYNKCIDIYYRNIFRVREIEKKL